METLRFIIKGQMIKKDPSCPFNRMVAGTSNYYIAEFDMDDCWNGYSCVAQFVSDDGTVRVPIISGKVVFPDSVLKHSKFTVSVIGKKGSTILNTNDCRIMQTGGI
jgi:hypothetical protein